MKSYEPSNQQNDYNGIENNLYPNEYTPYIDNGFLSDPYHLGNQVLGERQLPPGPPQGPAIEVPFQPPSYAPPGMAERMLTPGAEMSGLISPYGDGPRKEKLPTWLL